MQVNSARCPRQTDMVLAPAIYIWESPDYIIINVKRKVWNLLGKFIELLETMLRLTWLVIWSQWKESKLENKRTNCQNDMYIVLRYKIIPKTNCVKFNRKWVCSVALSHWTLKKVGETNCSQGIKNVNCGKTTGTTK